MLRITTIKICCYPTDKTLMKQKEKLDLLLKQLYNHKADHQYADVYDIFALMKDEVSETEAELMVQRLEDLNLIEKIFTKDGLSAKITSKGIEYCEEDSFAQNGSPIVNNHYNLNIKNSPNSNIINQSSNVKIGSDIEQIDSLLNDILEKIISDQGLAESRKNDIKKCVEEIKNNLKEDKVPEFGLKTLLSLLSDVSSVSGLAINLAQYV